MKLAFYQSPEVPLEAEVITPERLAGLSESEVSALPLQYGNERVPLGEFFRVSGRYQGEVRIEGDLSWVKMIGSGMSAGRITIDGHVGMHLGAGMSGGEITVSGNAGDWVAPGLSGGRITIGGNAGHMVGSAYRGSNLGVLGGEILIHGNVGNEAGNGMRRGLIAIGGDCGDFAGVNLRAGTIVALGHLGGRPGAGMKRGSIVSMQPAQLLPTYGYACRYRPAYLRLYLLHLRRLGMSIAEAQLEGAYRRYSGDAVETNRGEILLLDA